MQRFGQRLAERLHAVARRFQFVGQPNIFCIGQDQPGFQPADRLAGIKCDVTVIFRDPGRGRPGRPLRGRALLRAFLFVAVALGALGGGERRRRARAAAPAFSRVRRARRIGPLIHGRAPQPFIYSNGEIRVLPLLARRWGVAASINDHGQVVGWLSSRDGCDCLIIFIYQNGQIADLNALPGVADAGWEITSARMINNPGQICGTGKFQERYTHYLLLPLPRAADTPG
jgi:probable HAF family extracellular repeat protein